MPKVVPAPSTPAPTLPKSRAQVDIVNFIRDSVKVIMESYLFEVNDEITRRSVADEVRLMLKKLVASQHISDSVVECNEVNNPPKLIDSGCLRADVWIQPFHSVDLVHMWFTLVPGNLEPVMEEDDLNQRYDRAMGVL